LPKEGVMKKFLIILFAVIFCFTAALAMGCNEEPEKTQNVLKYKKERLTFTLEEQVFSYSAADITKIITVGSVLSSSHTTVENESEIKDFFKKLFNGKNNGFDFNAITQEQYRESRAVLYSTVEIYKEAEVYEFILCKDGQKIFYVDSERELYYMADTGDLTSLYESYIRG